MSFVTTHTSMLDVAELYIFPLVQTQSKGAEPSEAMAVERPSAQPKDTELLKSSERHLVYTSGYKRK